ncbi:MULTISPECIES: hypothetical protein [Rhizobium]|nr:MULTISPECIES: hypothetical protein [Rhizobium]
MKLFIILLLGATVFATPCIYDISSREPSPFGGFVAAVGAGDW